jgi:hypothetical protein
MNTQPIRKTCEDVLAMANDEWLITPDECKPDVLRRIDKLCDRIHDQIESFNEAVTAEIPHHPGHPLAETFELELHRIDDPSGRKTGKEMKNHDEEEVVLSVLPIEIVAAHRYARLVLEDIDAIERGRHVVDVVKGLGSHSAEEHQHGIL